MVNFCLENSFYYKRDMSHDMTQSAYRFTEFGSNQLAPFIETIWNYMFDCMGESFQDYS